MVRRRQLRLVSVFLVLFFLMGRSLGAAESVTTVNPRLGPEDDAYLNRQAKAHLDFADGIFRRVPPQFPEPAERQAALMILDGVLHDEYAPNREAVQRFYHDRIASAVQEMESTRVENGAMIWKLYNHGFVVRTATVTLAFDLVRGPKAFHIVQVPDGHKRGECPGFPISEELASRLVQQCDVLFVSHKHGDHADPAVAEAFLAQGKPVVAPLDAFADASFHDKIMHRKREAHTLQRLPIQQGKNEIQVVVYPGQQYQGGSVANNVVLAFTPEGMSFAHNGDQINDPYPYQEDYAWIDKVRDHHKVDVLMTNCWTDDIYRQTKGFDPKLVLPGHQVELGHPVWDRVPYWGDSEHLKLTYPQLLASGYPVIVMTWGESCHYVPKPVPHTPASSAGTTGM